MAILLKKKNQLLKSLSSNFNINLRRKWNSTCSWIDNPPLPSSSPKGSNKLLVKRFSRNDDSKTGIEYSFSRFTPENFSAKQVYYFRYRWLEAFLEFAPTCNGLLYVYNKSGDAAIWNASTEEGILLPSHAKPPTSIIHVCALGFDSKSRDYKVVRFTHNCVVDGEGEEEEHFKDETGVELYSFKSNSWKILDYDDGVYDFPSPSVYLNGRSYWVRDKSVLSFDFGDESFSSFALPNCLQGEGVGSSYAFDLMEFDGSQLGCIVYPRVGIDDPVKFGARKWFEVWVMKGDGLWSRELAIPPFKVEKPLGFWRNGQLLFENVCLNAPLLAYDVRTKDFIQLHIGSDVGNMEIFPYVESMTPMDDQLQL